jgi:prepilin-type processing-associated H-X9-DG protein
MAANYAAANKIFDCPTTSFTGKSVQPDYYYIAGSFLAGAALNDVSSPTDAVLIAELKNPSSNPCYVNDNDTGDLSKAVAQCDAARHNSGTIFGYVDGHVNWTPSNKVSTVSFAYSIANNSKVSGVPITDPVMANLDLKANPSAIESDLKNKGYKTLLCSSAGYASLVGNLPGWLIETPTLNLITGTPYTNVYSGQLPWNGANRIGVQGWYYNTAQVTDVVMLPKTSGMRRIAMIFVANPGCSQLNTANYNPQKARIVTVTFGTGASQRVVTTNFDLTNTVWPAALPSSHGDQAWWMASYNYMFLPTTAGEQVTVRLQNISFSGSVFMALPD